MDTARIFDLEVKLPKGKALQRTVVCTDHLGAVLAGFVNSGLVAWVNETQDPQARCRVEGCEVRVEAVHS